MIYRINLCPIYINEIHVFILSLLNALCENENVDIFLFQHSKKKKGGCRYKYRYNAALANKIIFFALHLFSIICSFMGINMFLEARVLSTWCAVQRF